MLRPSYSSPIHRRYGANHVMRTDQQINCDRFGRRGGRLFEIFTIWWDFHHVAPLFSKQGYPFLNEWWPSVTHVSRMTGSIVPQFSKYSKH